MLTLFLTIASLHFGRTLAGNLYRACPAYVLPAEQLCSMLGYYKEGETTIDEAGNQHVQTIPDVARITLFERTRFYFHCLLSS